jgi:tetratricopeptide (TPR) repeat protein
MLKAHARILLLLPNFLLLPTRVSSSYTNTHCSRTPQTLSHSYNAHHPHSPPTLCHWYAQTKAWKAGHKHESSLVRESSMPAQSRSAVRQAARTPTFMTDDQVRQCAKLSDMAELSGSGDWRGVVAMEREAMRMAAAVRRSMPGLSATVHSTLGSAFWSLGDFAKAIDYDAQHLAITKEVVDRAEEGMVHGNVGLAYYSLGDFCKAIEYHAQHLAIAKEMSDRAAEGGAYANLGTAHQSLGDMTTAFKCHTMHLAIAKEIGDWEGEGNTYGNLGLAYMSLGDFNKAVEYHTLRLAMAKEAGDRVEEGKGYGNLETHIGRKTSTSVKYHSGTWRSYRRWATGRERAWRTGTSETRIIRKGTSTRRSSSACSAWRSQRSWATVRGRERRTRTSGVYCSLGAFS